MSERVDIAGLSPEEKRALAAELLRGRAAQPVAYPLSYGQQALWLFQRSSPESPAYNLAGRADIAGALDLAALRRAFHRVLDRHPQLRATYAVDDGRLLQQIQPSDTFELAVVAAEGWSEARVAAWYAAEADRPFDLGRGPLLRATVLARGPREHRLIFVAHHIAVDFWSLQIVLRDLRSLYAAERDGEHPDLPPLRARYSDFVAWQRELLDSTEGERHWAYWQAQLAGELPVLDLPMDRPRPAERGMRGSYHSVTLDERLAARLRALALAQSATTYVTALSAFFVLLSRYTGQDDLIVGAPIAGRSRADFEEVVGFFVNQVPVRVQLTNAMTFVDLVRQVRQTMLDALAHHDFPYAAMVERLRLSRDERRSPLHQVSLNWTQARLLLPPQERGPLSEMTLLGVEQRGAALDLSVVVTEGERSLTVTFQYDADLFNHRTIERMAAHFRVLLESVVADPSQAIAALPLLTEAERHQMLVEWNQTESDFPGDRLIFELFEDQVRQRPDATAVVFDDQRLSYRELNRRANQLARFLRARGAGPETIVGVCLDRSPEQIVAVVAIAKAGAAYLPLDIGLPPARLGFMLEDTAAPIVLTQARLLDLLPEHSGMTVALDRDGDIVAQEAPDDPRRVAAPDNLAYVIYTSGSTGTPKGVLVEHRNLCNFIISHLRILQEDATSRQLQFTTPSFDPSVSEIWRALVAGAELHLARQDVLSSGPGLLELMRERRITHAGPPPALLAVLPSVELPDLRSIVCGGDAVTREVVARWAPGRRFVNSYGPTEATVASSVHVCDAAAPVNPPIGRPIANAKLYVLDWNQQLVPVGVPGELYIGGAGVARGYLNQPELTAERFLPDPFSERTGARLYRTGDLVRYRPDGNLDSLGRIDNQVKIRGFRVELGEVETKLRLHPAVRDTVVVPRGDSPEDRRLVAYLSLLPGSAAPDNRDLRRHLAELLPDFMIPSAFITLAELPLLPSGKIDRNALPEPPAERWGLAASYVAPRTPFERTLATIWQEVLEVERVGVDDDFFDLGGASLQVLEVVARAEQVDIPLSPDLLFAYPTITKLAELLDPGWEM